jgi:hypothetical protein
VSECDRETSTMMRPSSTRGSCVMGNYTIKMKVVNAREAQCNYMTYIVTYRSNIFIHFGSESITVHDLSYGKHGYILCVPLLQLQ